MFNIILLGITSLLTDISSEMVYPLLPIYLVNQLGASPAILGFIEGIAESSASLLKVFSGYFSDRLKLRKPFTILGYAASAAGKLFLYISGGWGLVFFGRLIDRIGKGVRTAPRDALIADSAQAEKRGQAYGLHRTMDTLGAVSGVLLAYLIITRYKGDFKNVFFISLIPAALGIIVLFLVREKKREQKVRAAKVEFRWHALDRRLKMFLIFTFIFTLGNSSNQFLLLRAKSLGNPLGIVILLYLFYNITYCLMAYPAARLSDRIGRKKLLVAGYFIYGLVYLGFALNNSAANLWLLFGLYGFYIGFTEGVEKALVVDIAPQGLRATAIGLHAALVGIGLFPASLLAGLLWKYAGASAPFYFAGFMGITASIGLWFILKDL
ncbi:MAG: MFS transporter [Candidatus Omnitrophica bacterium]|nr:MFS transporter [Candidatus Omnitrophota bacterium]